MPHPARGEFWMVDLGLAAKVRPCLLLTGWPADNELALVTVMAHTRTLRGNPWELRLWNPLFKEGAFHLQQIHSIPIVKLERKLGTLTAAELKEIEQLLRQRLEIGPRRGGAGQSELSLVAVHPFNAFTSSTFVVL
jgi:mRNA interferase MazF